MYYIFVPGKPFAKERPRFAGGHAFTPGKTLGYEAKVANMWSLKYPSLKMLSGNIEMWIWAYFPVPMGASKVKTQQMLSGDVYPATSKDWDNISKIICDGLNQVAYYDDKQICEAHVWKRYSEKPGVLVVIEEKSNGSRIT